MKRSQQLWLFLLACLQAVPGRGQTPDLDILSLKTEITQEGEIRACKGIRLLPGFSFDTSKGKTLHLLVDPSVCSPEVIEPLGASQGENYIITFTPLDGTQRLEFEDGNLTVDRDTRVLTRIQYFDGLGRLEQTVARGITPGGSDLITLQDYDSWGRPYREWLPVITQGKGMRVDPQLLRETAPAQTGDASPFERTDYEASPLSRVVRKYGPGQAWHSAHPQRQEYLTNDPSQKELSCRRYQMTSSTSFRNLGDYPKGELFLTRTTDEDGHLLYRFEDKIGRLLLERQIDNGEVHDTYYIYDNYGNRCVVLPPMASHILSPQITFTQTTPALLQYGYFYRYDSWNRCIEKQLPGCEPIFLVYDRSDRPVLSQDGEQRKTSRWSFFKYDALSRIIIEGECTLSGMTHQGLQQQYKEALVVESPDRSGKWGYSENTGINTSQQEVRVMKVNFYDRYPSSLPGMDQTLQATLSYTREKGYDSRYTGGGDNSTQGLLTASLTAIMEQEGKMLASCYYYDDKGRVIQKRSTNHLGGGDVTFSCLDFSGHPLSTKQVYSIPGKEPLIQYYTYSYDHTGRELACYHRIEGREEVNLYRNHYDERGRIQSRLLCNGGERVEYSYNIRSWLSETKGSVFCETLYYDQAGISGATPCFNGNICSRLWNFQGNHQKGYSYTYDGLNRLKKATYTAPDQLLLTRYNETLSYDKNGNILTLERSGVNRLKVSSSEQGEVEIMRGVTIDNLNYSYKGNQVKKITDTGESPLFEGSNDFKDGVDLEEEYLFDANGNMVADLNKGIQRIAYNRLNLADTVFFGSNSYIARQYDAGGVLLQQGVPWELVIEPGVSPEPVPSPSLTPGNNTLQGELPSLPPSSLVLSRTDYIGSCIYQGGTLKKILTPVGYIEPGVERDIYYFYHTDYQGNIRAVTNGSGKVIEKNDYYPFGMLFGECVGEKNKQPYKFAGKEYTTYRGYNLYNFGARNLNSSTAGWDTPDPLCENYFPVSPYAYCLNNPIRYIDPDGRFVGTILGVIIGGIKGGYDAYQSGSDIRAGAAEGVVAGLVTGAAIDGAIAATIATGGGALAVIGAGVAAGAAGGAVGAVAGDVTGQVVTATNENKTISEAVSNISTKNFSDKAIAGAVSGAVSGLTSGAVGALGNVATTSTKTLQGTMAENIKTTATTLTTQGASQSTVNTAVNNITKGMSNVGKSTTNSMIKVEAGVSTVTEISIKAMEEQLKRNTN